MNNQVLNKISRDVINQTLKVYLLLFQKDQAGYVIRDISPELALQNCQCNTVYFF